MKSLTQLSATILTATSGLVFGTMQAASALSLNWSYSGTDIAANGTFTTNDTPDDLGFYQITGITGTRNGETITGLQLSGIPIPGNEPIPVDNLISLNPAAQFTQNGFGYVTSGGNFVNPYFDSSSSTFFEVFSAPPFIPGYVNFGPEDSESTISFSATAVPEPNNTLSLLALGTLGIAATLIRKRKSALPKKEGCVAKTN